MDKFRRGCSGYKQPSSAGEGTNGLLYDVVPGSPDQSILYFRTFTEDVGAMMPQIGRSLAHSGARRLSPVG